MKKKKFEKSIRRFTRFLKEQDAFYAFRRNYDVFFYSKNAFARQDITCRQYLDKVQSCNFIVHAFHWMDSIEGYEFWYNLDIEWRYIIKKECL